MRINLLAWALDDKLWMCWILGGRPPEVEEGYSDEACLSLQNNPASVLKQDEKPQALMEALEIFSFSFQRSLLVSWFTHTKSS